MKEGQAASPTHASSTGQGLIDGIWKNPPTPVLGQEGIQYQEGYSVGVALHDFLLKQVAAKRK